MITVHLLCVGKSKFPWVDQGLAHYQKLLAPFLNFDVMETRTVTGNLTPTEQMARESELLTAKIPGSSDLVCLDRTGTQMDSEAFAGWLQNAIESGRDLTLLVGGPHGLDPTLKDRARHVISLSKVTFPHDLVRLICAEQLYRAVTILRGHPYHK